MINVFLDSSVILSFCRSTTGASAFILELCELRKIKGNISKKVIEEVYKNNTEDKNKLGELRYDYIIKLKVLNIVEDVSPEELEEANEAFNNPKDAPIIAATKHTPRVTFLLSLDNGFFKPEVKNFIKPLKVLKPGEFVNRFREELEG